MLKGGEEVPGEEAGVADAKPAVNHAYKNSKTISKSSSVNISNLLTKPKQHTKNTSCPKYNKDLYSFLSSGESPHPYHTIYIKHELTTFAGLITELRL